MSNFENIFLEISDRRYFFDKGIHFECQRCGACCTGEPGSVYIDLSEIGAIADFLGIKSRTFGQKYLARLGNRYSIKEDSLGRCVFYHKGCAIYPVRPNQCRTY